VKRVRRTAVWFVIVTLFVAVGVERPSRVSGLDTGTSESVLTAWRTGQTSSMLDEAKVHGTVDTYFRVEYANQQDAAFSSRAPLLCADTNQAKIWANYTDALLKYKIMCWRSMGYVPTAYTYTPKYGSVAIDHTGLAATVIVYPTCTLEFSSEHTSDPAGFEQHTLTLRKSGGIWQIDHDTVDSADAELYPLNTDFDALTKSYAARLAAWETEQANLTVAWQEDVATMKKNDDPRLHLLDPQKGGDAVSTATGANTYDTAVSSYPGYTDYNRSRAAQYTMWTNGISGLSGTAGWGWNPKFPPANTDCMNFASQVVWFGFGGINDSAHINSHALPMVTSGGTAWYPGCTSWNNVLGPTDNGFLPTIDSNRISNLAGVQGWKDQVLGGIEAGDLIEEITPDVHMMAVAAVVDKHNTPTTTEYDEIYISAHDTDICQYPLINWIADKTRVHFVWIMAFKIPVS